MSGLVKSAVDYGTLNSRQKENFNFHLVAARLAFYGYNSIRVTDDFGGADFVAIHVNGSNEILRVQLKGRLTLAGKYEGKRLFIAFRSNTKVYLYDHDEMVRKVEASGRISGTKSWSRYRSYTWPSVPKWAAEFLKDCEL